MIVCKKVKYGSQKFADEEIVRYNIKNDGKHKLLKRAYFCSKCNGWHITSQDDFSTLAEINKKLLAEIKELKSKAKIESKDLKDKKVVKQRFAIIELSNKCNNLTQRNQKLENKVRKLEEYIKLLKSK